MIDARVKNIYLNIQSDLNSHILQLSMELEGPTLTENEKALIRSAVSNMRAAISRLEAVNRLSERRR